MIKCYPMFNMQSMVALYSSSCMVLNMYEKHYSLKGCSTCEYEPVGVNNFGYHDNIEIKKYSIINIVHQQLMCFQHLQSGSDRVLTQC